MIVKTKKTREHLKEHAFERQILRAQVSVSAHIETAPHHPRKMLDSTEISENVCAAERTTEYRGSRVTV